MYVGVISSAQGESFSSRAISMGVHSAGGFLFQKSESDAFSRPLSMAPLPAHIRRCLRLKPTMPFLTVPQISALRQKCEYPLVFDAHKSRIIVK